MERIKDTKVSETMLNAAIAAVPTERPAIAIEQAIH